jgi:hypothetical protein
VKLLASETPLAASVLPLVSVTALVPRALLLAAMIAPACRLIVPL